MAYVGLASLVPYRMVTPGCFEVPFTPETGGYGKIVHGGAVVAVGVQLIAECSPEGLTSPGRLEAGLVRPMMPGSSVQVQVTHEGGISFVRFFQEGGDAPTTVVRWKDPIKAAPEGRDDLLARLAADPSPHDHVTVRVVKDLHDPAALRARFGFDGALPVLDDVFADLGRSVVTGPDNPKGLMLAFFSTPEDLRSPDLLLFMRLGAHLIDKNFAALLMAIDEVGMWLGAIATEPGVTGYIECNFFQSPPEGAEVVIVAARSEVQIKRLRDRATGEEKVTSAIVPVFVLGGAGEVYAQARITFMPSLSAAVAGVMKR